MVERCCVLPGTRRVRSGLFLPMAAGNSRTKTLWLCVLWFWWQQILIGSYYHVTLGNSGDTTSGHALEKHPLYWCSRNARVSNLSSPHGVSAQAIITWHWLMGRLARGCRCGVIPAGHTDIYADTRCFIHIFWDL